MNEWTGKRVLITGVCGTVGGELLRQVLATGPAQIVGLDNNESAIFFLKREYAEYPSVALYVGDVRDPGGLCKRMDGIDIVLHTAAYKHVEVCEESPRDTVLNNVLGVQNMIDAALENQVERVLFTSSDKAVNPTSVMGTSKLLGERLMTAANMATRTGRPLFAATRFGNVLGSRGSVIPLFRKQIAAGGPVTVTDPDMSRFIMSLDEAVRLVMESMFLARGGEVFITKMATVRIPDLARVMIDELAPDYGYDPGDIALEMIGSKPGEKMFEELLTVEEVRRTIELERYFVVLPALQAVDPRDSPPYPGIVSLSVEEPYNSANQPSMANGELRSFLATHELFGATRPQAAAKIAAAKVAR